MHPFKKYFHNKKNKLREKAFREGVALGLMLHFHDEIPIEQIKHEADLSAQLEYDVYGLSTSLGLLRAIHIIENLLLKFDDIDDVIKQLSEGLEDEGK